MMKKIALITGASSGIGEAAAFEFALNGYNLILTARRSERLHLLADKLREDHQIDVLPLVFDVQNYEDCLNALSQVPEEWKKVSVLLNNAGLSLGLDPFYEGNVEDWDTMIDTNVKGLLYVSKIVSNWMIKEGKGHIINLGSIAGKESYLNGNAYCASKAAVDSLSKSMRMDLLKHKIKVSVIHPGAVNTEFSTVRFKGDVERANNVYKGYEPLTAQDVAESIYFIASRPAHVNINDMLIMPTAQANSYLFEKQID